MTEDELSYKIIGCCIRVHKKLGPGVLESVYHRSLFIELQKSSLKVQMETPIKAEYDGTTFEQGFRADLIVENSVLIEVKAVQKLNQIHRAQLLSYLKMTNLKLGLLINFHSTLLKDGIRRIVNNL